MLRQFRCVAVVALLMSASVAFAQRPGGGQGGFGGFGGFGGGGGGGTSSLTLAANAAVQKELNLNDEQVGDIKSLGEKVREEMQPLFAGGFGGRDQSEEERTKTREKMTEGMKKVNDKFQPKLNEILEAAQRDRLKQIQIQAAGAQAYQNPDVIAALKLSKEQQDKLAVVSKEFGDKQRELFPRGGFGGGGAAGGERPSREEMQKKMEENQKKMTELNATRDKQLAEVLTADQKADFEKLKGKTFDVAQLRPQFGGGPGGQGGGGGANPAGRPRRQPAADEKKDN